jgi:hypothetical protein
VDRCALFVDAGYVLADGAMAVHGTRRGESVSWDYEGLLQLLSSLARERSGLPLLRCYWYEATVDGRRTAEQDALADLPGIKLRVAKIRPGRREGVETEIHRDLTTLARNSAISDAIVVSAEEDLAQVIADVQDLGMRVTLVHIAVDGNWTISRALRQESDDILEIGGDHLRPFVELIAGAEPALADEETDSHVARPLANGHSTAPAASYQPVPAGTANHAPPSIYTAPVVAEYQRSAVQLPRPARETREPREDRAREDRAREERTPQPAANGEAMIPARQDNGIRQDNGARQDIGARQDNGIRQDNGARPDIYAAPSAGTRGRPEPAAPAAPNQSGRSRSADEAAGYVPPGPQPTPDPAVNGAPAAAAGLEAQQAPPGQLRRLPSSRTATQTGPLGGQGQHSAPSSQGLGSQPMGSWELGSGGQHSATGPNQLGLPGQGSPRSAPYSGPQPVANGPGPGYQTAAPSQGGGMSLSDAVQAAHTEGQEFGGSVARDAPALWLEAVLARKPRMPSDLEARLLQGSSLPIDFLLHDEVRHALRRGFWDALERTRR